jgi:hypothetical protein
MKSIWKAVVVVYLRRYYFIFVATTTTYTSKSFSMQIRTQRRGLVVDNPALYLGGPGFKSRLVDELS